MNMKLIYLILSFLIVLSFPLASCTPSVEEVAKEVEIEAAEEGVVEEEVAVMGEKEVVTVPSPTPTTTPTPTSETTSTPTPTPRPAPTPVSTDFIPTLSNHFGFMPAHWNFPGAREAGGAFDRPNFEIFQWGLIEFQPGKYDFRMTDRQVRQSGDAGLHILANIQPFAKWDQEACHTDLPVLNSPVPPKFQTTKGKPCDMEAYKGFIIRLVERYDGDGVDDMPGLVFPIKHWEIMNEPSFQHMYFQGAPTEYVAVLEATREAIKKADSESLIVQGGMAGMMDICTDFWQGVFDAGGDTYIDIMNMHSIGHGEHLNIPAFKKFLTSNGIQGKPIWVTEVQYQQSRQTKGYTNEDFAKILARSYIFALANGVDKLFYVNTQMPPVYDANIPFGEESALFSNDGDQNSLFQAHATIAGLLGNLKSGDTVEVLSERVGSWYIEEGHYKFNIDGKTVFALFGGGKVPAEISGQITVLDIDGVETMMEASEVRLSDSPIFIIID